MKVKLFVLAAFALALVAPRPAPASPEPTISYFYEELAPYGDWVDIAPYGWVWSPGDIPIGWRPYTIGHWVLTDAGPTWLSDENWGWICFHYGRWTYDPDYGWVWVPGTVWAPNWCAWRHGNGLVGWAPLPPRVGWSPDRGLRLRGFDLDDIDDFKWCFVRQRALFQRRIDRFLAMSARNVTLIRRTRNITRFAAVGRHAVDRSVGEARAARWVGHRVPRLRIVDLGAGLERWSGEVRRGEIFLRRPRVSHGPPAVPPPRFRPRQQREGQVQRRTPPIPESPRRLEPGGRSRPGPERPGRIAPERRERVAPERQPTVVPERRERARPGKPGHVLPETRAPGSVRQAAPERYRERQELLRRQRHEREELQRVHRRERRNVPRGPSREKLLNRENQETRSLQEQQGRERREFENRYQRRPQGQEREREQRPRSQEREREQRRRPE